MTTEKMTIHKALTELKTIDSRIEKKIGECTFVFANKHSNTRVGGKPIDDYCKEVTANFQAAKDLMKRRDALKRAVVLSNATTTVDILGTKLTVAEAIEWKNHRIPMLMTLLSKLEKDSKSARKTADNNNGDALERRADDYVKSLYGNATDLKNLSDEIKKTRADFIATQSFDVVDPIKSAAEMDKLSKEINGFSVEVDSALSVSNALTEITIEH